MSSSVSKSAVEVTDDEREDAHRLFKSLKNGIVTTEELTPRDFGLLFLYYPTVLPGVEIPEELGQ